MTAQAVDAVLGVLAQQLGAKAKQARMTRDNVGILAATDPAIAAGHISEETEMRMMTQGHVFTHLAACEAGAGAAPHRPDAASVEDAICLRAQFVTACRIFAP